MTFEFVQNRPLNPEFTPQEMEEDIEIVGKEFIERLELDLKDVLKQGFLIFGRASAQERLGGYIRSTLATEMNMFLEPDYLDKVHLGLYPPPMQYVGEEPVLDAAGTPQLDPTTGQPMMKPITSPWWYWFQLPSYVFEFFANDFRTLLTANLRRAE